jgi:hypothetical protein
MMPESCNKQKQRSAVETSTAWQWLDKHIPRAMTDELLEAVCSLSQSFKWSWVPKGTEPRKTALTKPAAIYPTDRLREQFWE